MRLLHKWTNTFGARFFSHIAQRKDNQDIFSGAERIVQGIIYICEKVFGPMHHVTAEQLDKLAEMYWARGLYKEAEPLFTRALEIREQALGAIHPLTATSLHHLGMLRYCQGQYDQAEDLLKRSLDVRQQVLRTGHPEISESLHGLAMLYKIRGVYDQAKEYFEQALEICRTEYGPNHAHTASVLHNFGSLHLEQGHYAQAERHLTQAFTIYETQLGPLHANCAASLEKLAALCVAQANYTQAKKYYQRAVDINEQLFGPNRFETAVSLHNLGGLYYLQGADTEAEKCFQRVLAICEEQRGPDHIDTANSLNSLAQLYQRQGAYAQAEQCYQRSLTICEKQLGLDHPYTAFCLNNFAGLYTAQRAYAEAKELYLRALAIREQLGHNHPETATTLDDLGNLYAVQGGNANELEVTQVAYAQAESYYQQALAMRQHLFGPIHPNTAMSLNGLAGLYAVRGEYAKAEEYYQQALDIYKRHFGSNHPDTATIMNNLALLYATTGRFPLAFESMKQAASAHNHMIAQVFAMASESRRMSYLQTLRTNLDHFLSLVSQDLLTSPEAIQAALTLVLQRKALGAEALAAQRDAVLGGKYPVLADQLQKLTERRAQVAQKILAGPGVEGADEHQRLLAEWATQMEQLETELAQQIPEMKLDHVLRHADHQAVARALPDGVVLLELVRFHMFHFRAVRARGERAWGSAHYLVFVAEAGKPDNIHMVDLGDAESIDHLIANFRQQLQQGGNKRGLQGQLKAEKPSDDENAGRELQARLFKPLAAYLTSGSQLFVAPDGEINCLPIHLLPIGDKRRLRDNYHVTYLSTGRDVLRLGVPAHRVPSAPIVVADPNFDLSAASIPGRDSELTVTKLLSHPASAQSPAGLDHGERFDRLFNSRYEGERIANLLGIQPWLADEALERKLKACRSPRILHVATHGYFSPNQSKDPPEEPASQQERVGVSRLRGANLGPMLRSGLALAGANSWLTQKPLPQEAGNGLLTAADAVGLDLLDTELVVLSACETGLGTVQVGEGVLGLRRAFMIAGAKTLVMSLWQVPDFATALLMERFYENLITRQFRRDEALMEAQDFVRERTAGDLRPYWSSPEVRQALTREDTKMKQELDRLATLQDSDHPYQHPYYWGAFILQGDPSPLHRL